MIHGKFTAFIGYEWTSLDKGNNLHRVIIYRDDADKTLGQIPAVTNALSPIQRHYGLNWKVMKRVPEEKY